MNEKNTMKCWKEDSPVIPLNRRTWLTTAVVGLGAWTTSVEAQNLELNAEETQAQNEVLARAKEVGLGRLDQQATDHFIVLGNASAAFMTQASEICENLLADYLAYFQARKFAIHPPERRLVLVILATPKGQLKFLGDDDQPKDAAPVFDPDANRLVFFDLRASGIKARQGVRERYNTVALCHEASLLLMENTGLLHPEGDAPTAIREGLANFLENRPPSGRYAPGRSNTGKLSQLFQKHAAPWIPISRLLSDEKVLEEDATVQLAQAESWVLVDYLVRSPSQVPKFVRYLEAVNARRDSTHRLEDARAHLGDLDKLDKAIQARVGEWRTYYTKFLETQKKSKS